MRQHKKHSPFSWSVRRVGAPPLTIAQSYPSSGSGVSGDVATIQYGPYVNRGKNVGPTSSLELDTSLSSTRARSLIPCALVGSPSTPPFLAVLNTSTSSPASLRVYSALTQ